MNRRRGGTGIICAGMVLMMLPGCQEKEYLHENAGIRENAEAVGSTDVQVNTDLQESTEIKINTDLQESTEIKINTDLQESTEIKINTDLQESAEGFRQKPSAFPDAQNTSDAEQNTERRGTQDIVVPELLEEGWKLEDFVAEGWVLLDEAELDFNGDGVSDYVAVLEVEKEREVKEQKERTYRIFPRILFAVAGDGEGKYHLDFQDENLIRRWSEGGVFGDPYLPLTAEGSSFTIHSYGGSGWKWSEDYTYTWKEGTWYLTCSKNTYGYGQYITSYKENNWETGIGVRKERSSAFEDMEKNGEKKDEADWDIVYELSLDKPLTLFQAGKRSNLLPDRVKDWEVSRVEPMEGIDISPDKIRYPGNYFLMDYRDEEGIFYSFSEEEGRGSCLNIPPEESGKNYLAFYRWEDKVLSILAEEKGEIGQVEFYQGKVYYALEGTRLCRMNLDGSKKETVFDYCALEKNQQGYMALHFEINRREIIVEMYLGDYPHPYYRMNTDGSGLYKIGQVPAASE